MERIHIVLIWIIVLNFVIIGMLIAKKNGQNVVEVPYPYPQQEQPQEPLLPEQPPEPVKIEPKWTELKPVRQISGTSVLDDIDSHLQAGNIYASDDDLGHERIHGINGVARQKFGGTGRINAFYCLKNRVAVITEPKGSIHTVANYIPHSLRGDVYQLYLIRQAADWGDTPLYLCDEWIAYTSGSIVRLDIKKQSRGESVQYMLEFNVYVLSLAANLPKDYDDAQFKAFLTWNLERTMEVYRKSVESGGVNGAIAYWNKVKTNSDGESLREFVRQYLGQDWCKKNLEF